MIPYSCLCCRPLSIWCGPCKAVDSLPAECALELRKCQNIFLPKNSREGVNAFRFFYLYRYRKVFIVCQCCGQQVSNILVKEFSNHHKVYIWDCKGISILIFIGMNLAVYVSEFESSYNVCLLDTNMLAIRMLGLNLKYRRLEGKSNESINKSLNRVNHRIQHRSVSSNFQPGPGWIRSFRPGTQKIRVAFLFFEHLWKGCGVIRCVWS